MSGLLPKLRFKEFSKQLNTYDLINLSENGLSNGVFNDSKKVGSGYKLINVKDMYVGEVIDINNLTLLDIDPSEFERNKVKYGDVFFTRSSIVPSGIAYSNVNLSYDDDITFDGHLMKLSPRKDIVIPSFLAATFKTWTLRNKFISRGKQSTMTTIGQSDIADIPIALPELQEQKKVADFLTSVDTKISQLTEKHHLLKDYKKGVLQQIFSQKIRFKDDDGNDFPNWNEYALRDILILQSDALKMDDEATYELITVKRGFGGVKSRGHFKGKDVLVKNQFTIHKGEFVISKRQIVHGACGLVPEELDGAIVSNEYNVFRPQPTKLDIDYFNRLSTTLYMRRAFFIHSDGVHIEKLLFKTQSWLKTKVHLPCLKEQQKIAQFLQSLDKKIDAVNEQIEQTKLFKKGLLQQMFV